MTVEQLIKELQQYFPKMEVQTEVFQTLRPIRAVKKMRVKQVKNHKNQKSIVVIE